MIRLAFIFFVALSFVSCSKTDNASPITVNTGGNKYLNNYFGLGVEKPEGWYAQSAEETIMLQQKGNAIVAGDDKNMRAIIEAALESSIPIFGFFEFPPGTPGKLNPNVLSVAENVKVYPGLKTGCDYIYVVKEMLSKGQLTYEFGGECKNKVIGGKEFGYIDASLILDNQTIAQRYYALVDQGYAITVVQTFFDEESHQKVNKVVSSIEFKIK